MVEKTVPVYEFGNFRLSPSQRLLVRDGQPVALTAKAFDTLVVLLQGRGRILEKDELMKILWPGSFVEDGNLTQNIFVLRRALGDDQNGNRFIETIPRRGYRFAVAVKEVDSATLEPGFAGGRFSSLQADYWVGRSPFRGLQVFEAEDAWLFFGREAETDELLSRLGRSPMLTVIGSSGSGKSSLVRAGLIPAIRAGRFQSRGAAVKQWRVGLFRPSGAPFDYLAEVLVHQLAPELSLKDQAEFIADCRNKLPSGGEALRNAISALAGGFAEKSGPTHILLVADQFEEIFSLTSNRQIRDHYIEALLAASHLNSAVVVHLVLVLRADFYASCLDHPELSRCMEDNLYNVPRMTHEQLRTSVEKRLALATASAEPGLIESLLEDVGTEPGDLALLEHALDQLWDRCRGTRRLTNQSYAGIGRLRGSLGRHADAVYAAIGNEKDRRLAKEILLQLVHLGDGAQDTRRRVQKTDLIALGSAPEIEQLLERLTSGRLIAAGTEGQATFFEVSHEALIREWPALREWLAENREDLRLQRRLLQAAEEWRSLKRDSGALLQGARLAQAEEWLAKHEDAPPLLQEFLQESMEGHIESARKERDVQERDLAQQKYLARLARRSAVRFRWFSSALGLMLVIAVGAAWFAHKQQVIAESSAMAAQAGELLPRDHGRALDLAIRSWNIAKTEESRLAVAKTSTELLRVLPHDGQVWWATFSPDSRLILTASDDHAARIWNVADGRLVATLKHDDAVPAGTFSPDGQRIVTASADHTARVWSSIDGRLLATLKGHTDKVWAAEFSPDGRRIATASSDHTARVWNSDDGQPLATLTGHTGLVGCARFSADGRRIATTSWDRTLRVWDSTDGHLLNILSGHESEAIGADFFPYDNRIVTTSFDKTARVWDSTDGRLLFTLDHDGPVVNASVSPDGTRILTASRDHAARIWDSSNGRLLFTLPHDGPVVYAAFSADGRYVVTTGHDVTTRLWSTVDGRLLASLQGHTTTVYTAVVAPDRQHIVTASFDHTARVWRIGAGRTVTALQGHTGWVYSAASSKDGQRIVTASSDQTAKVWNSATGRLLATLRGHQGRLTYAEFSPDGRHIVTASRDHTARLWNAADGRPLATLEGHSADVWRTHFSPDGQRIMTASSDHTARLWNASDGQPIATLRGHDDEILGARFSPDGQRILTASKDHTAKVWRTSGGRLLLTLQGHTGEIREAAFSGDGQRIVTASGDHTAKVWNSSDGRLLFTLQGHNDAVMDAEFSSDGKSIVTGSQDHTARVWNSSDGSLLASLQGHTDEVWQATFSPDDQHIVTASADRTVRVWNRANGELLGTLQGHSGEITYVGFLPSGQGIVTASKDQTARVWRLLTLDDIERILANK